jgi:hypothetical protein
VNTRIRYFDGAEAKLRRLELGSLLEEALRGIQSITLYLVEAESAKDVTELQEQLDGLFKDDRTPAKVGDTGWVRCKSINGTHVCLGVEIQVSGRREMLYKDVLHLRRRIECGDIDLGVIVVPSDQLQRFLPDRTPSSSYAVKVIKEQDADRLPIILIEIEHDGPGPALIKPTTNTSRRE